MARYILKRLGISLLIVWGVLSITFLLMRLAPGDPSSLYIRPEIDAKTVENIRRQMGLELPLWRQYFLWIGEFMRGNFGVSFTHHRPVSEILAEAIPNTLKLTGVVYFLQSIAGIVLGVITAVKRGTKLDLFITSFLLFLYSMPWFWLGLMAIMLFSLKLGWLPSSQMRSLHVSGGFWAESLDYIKHLILPASILAMPFAASTARFVRNSLAEALEQNYIRTAKAYGIKSWKILFQYALKNALLPLVTLFGLHLPFLLGGAVITEHIFAWPGLGTITVNAIFAHDFPVILASTFIAALTVVMGNQISDFLYLLVDPRVRTGLSKN